MNEITVSAKTLDDAITEASIQLGVASDQMEYDVIEKGSAGFLGFGCKQAVIKARLKKAEEPEEEVVMTSEKPVDTRKEFKKEFKEHKERREYKKDSRKDFHKDSHKDSKKDFHKESKKDFKKDAALAYEKKAAPEKAPEEKVQTEKKELNLAVVTDETKTICEAFLRDVLKAMGMEEISFTSKVDEDGALAIEMTGENMGILIGKRGQTLDSLQYLTNRVANKSQDGYVRVKLDTEDYRKRRKQTLENLARNIAYKVKRTRKPVALEPMNPYERRIIHSALQGDDRVSTHSEGEEPYRRVVVTPNRR